RTVVPRDEFFRLVNENGIAVIGQTASVAPADKKIYALRDVTGTVENLSLITSSIMSKKLASGPDGILLDVKCGRGAFMKNEEDARALAEMMVEIGTADGRDTRAVITDMNQPLGCAAGNALEVREAIEVLQGRGQTDITELSVALAGLMIHMGGKAESARVGFDMAQQALADGRGLAKMKQFVAGQGGDPAVVDEPERLVLSEQQLVLTAPEDGYVAGLDAMLIGQASQETGAGRETKEDDIDHGAGVLLRHKIGDPVRQGEPLCVLYSSDERKLQAAARRAEQAFVIGDERPQPQPLIRAVIGGQPE
ncbi:MAG: thymidine phosphorylase, partial [Bacillota bacterium]|nr:thymidine phosphorylase [Bacillota bacterium]